MTTVKTQPRAVVKMRVFVAVLHLDADRALPVRCGSRFSSRNSNKGGKYRGRSLLCEVQGKEGNGQGAGSDHEERASRHAGSLS